jgi:hypothetical protein
MRSAAQGYRLELTFQTAELRDICEKRTVAAKELGYAAARELAERLADIEALDTVSDLSLLLGDAICDRSPTEKNRHPIFALIAVLRDVRFNKI